MKKDAKQLTVSSDGSQKEPSLHKIPIFLFLELFRAFLLKFSVEILPFNSLVIYTREVEFTENCQEFFINNDGRQKFQQFCCYAAL